MEKDLNNSSFGKFVYSAGKKLFGKKRSKSMNDDQIERKKIEFNEKIEQNTETYSIELYPAGKIYQLRIIEGKTYIKEAKHSEYERIILSNSCISDHNMYNYTKALSLLENL